MHIQFPLTTVHTAYTGINKTAATPSAKTAATPAAGAATPALILMLI